MKSFLQNLFELESPHSVGTKIYLRLFELFIVFNTLIFAWEWGFYILKLSDVVLPLGIAQYIDIELFYGNNLPIVNALAITFLSIAAFSFKKVKWLYGIVFILIHLQFVARYSQGEIPHSQSLLGLSMLGLGIGSVFLKDKQRSLHFAFGFVLFFIGLGYTTAGISKLIGTGITWIDGRHLWLWIGEKSTDVLSDTGQYQINFIQETVLNHWWFGTFILAAGIITELSGFMLWWKKFRVYIFIMLIGLHIGIYTTMNILFFYYSIELMIIGFPWHKLFNKAIDEKKVNAEHPLYNFLLY